MKLTIQISIIILYFTQNLTIQCHQLRQLQQEGIILESLAHSLRYMNSADSLTVEFDEYYQQNSYIEIKAYIHQQPDLISHSPILLLQKNVQQVTSISQMSRNDIQNSIASNSNLFYYDSEAFATRNNYHYISIPYEQGEFTIQFRDLLVDQDLKVDLNVYHLSQRNCYKQCQQCKITEFQCQCSKSLGSACEYDYELTQANYKYSFYKSPAKWISFAFYVQKDFQYEVFFSGLNKGSKFQYVYHKQSQIQAPNFEENYHSIESEQYTYTYEVEEINKYINYCDDLNQCDVPLLIISVYFPFNTNPNDHSVLELRELEDNSNQSIYFILLLTIGIILTVASIISCTYVCYKEKKMQKEQQQQNQNQNQNNNNNQNQNNNQLQIQQHNGPRIIIQKVAITQNSIEKYMPIVIYKEIIKDIEELQEQKECIVCLCDFEDDEECRVSVCFHVFHKGCIDHWIKKHGSCPFCRHKLTKKVFEDHETLQKELKSNPYMKKVIEQANEDQQSPVGSALSKMKAFDFVFDQKHDDSYQAVEQSIRSKDIGNLVVSTQVNQNLNNSDQENMDSPSQLMNQRQNIDSVNSDSNNNNQISTNNNSSNSSPSQHQRSRFYPQLSIQVGQQPAQENQDQIIEPNTQNNSVIENNNNQQLSIQRQENNDPDQIINFDDDDDDDQNYNNPNQLSPDIQGNSNNQSRANNSNVSNPQDVVVNLE